MDGLDDFEKIILNCL